MATDKERLLSEFPAISTQEWKDKIITDLKGADFDRKLVWRTNEGFNVNPFYRREDLEGLSTPRVMPAEYPYVRSTRLDNEWLIRQEIHVTDPQEANAKALDILNKGVTSLGFKLRRDQVNKETLAVLLKDIMPEAIELNFSCCYSVAVQLAEALAAYLTEAGANVAECKGSINFDPFKKQLVKGISNPQWIAPCARLLEAIRPLPGFRVLTVNALNINNAGAYIYQELGYALSWGAELLDKLTEAGFSIEELTSRIKFVFGVGSNYFMELDRKSVV